ncbi:MAG: hypothetical protein HYS09_02205 [Chloroflexi bacterium]|nr:hypothetical protein [Chloroflexota bacterium]
MPLQVWLQGNSGGWPSADVYDECRLVHGRQLEPGVFIDNRWECPVENVLPTLLPGALNLGAFLWLAIPRQRTRYAALFAGVLGGARLAAPALMYLVLDPVMLRTTFWPGPNASVAASLALWVVSVGAAVVFPFLFKAEPARD